MTNTTAQSSPTSVQSVIRQMVENQIDLNLKSYAATWFEDGKAYVKDYALAASQEVGEFINSYGYSWWSKSPRDVPNCKTEIVDAVHFMLSQTVIDCKGDVDVVVDLIVHAYDRRTNEPSENRSGLFWAKNLQAALLTKQSNEYALADIDVDSEEYKDAQAEAIIAEWAYLFLTADSVDFGISPMFLRYMGKSELNKFRQLNGYKQGTYRKLWDGVNEDNYFLAKWIDEASQQPEIQDIQPWLAAQYEAHLNKVEELAEGE